MTFPVSAVTHAATVQPLTVKPPAGPAATGAFGDVLKSAIDDVEKFRLHAEQKVGRFLAGEGEELHDVILSTQRAELSFELFQSVRNKVVQSYQEIMRMQM
jgi:flagellar hook-basal body complex protein FliE